MASMLKKDTQERNNKKYSQGSNTKASYLKSDAEFIKLFGLTKDLRVCLTRIPDHLGSRKDFDSFNNMVKNNSYRDADIVMKEEVKQVIVILSVFFYKYDKDVVIFIFYLAFNVH